MQPDTLLMPSANEVAASEGGTNEQKKGVLLYRIDENPKLYLSFLLGFQHYLTMFGATVGLPFVLGKFLCFDAIPTVMNGVLGTLFFCSGLVTLLQSTFGVRLPIVQGGTFAFIAPTAAIMALRPACPSIKATVVNATMGNGTITVGGEEAVYNEFESRMRELQGAIMISSLFQIFIGFSGMIGHVLRFIGPLTIAPTIALVGISLFQTAGFFAGTQWGIAFLTMVCIGLFSQVLKDVNVPLGCTRVQIFKLFPVLLAIIIAWVMSGILTAAGVYKEGSEARTDFRSNVLVTSKWFRFPYPGQWGLPTVTIAGVFGMLAGVLASMVESVGDYYACARLAGAQPPPKHAINRGIAIEGIGCLITGLFGTGNGTTSYSENIGAIGITRVGSIRVVQCGALFMVVLGVIAKFGAVFVTIPTPVIGGIFVIMFGMITAVGLSNLQFVDLNSMRNLFVLGVSFLLGLSLPSWVSGNQSSIDLGNDSLNQIIIVLLTTNMFVGGFSGFVLDNILPGTLEERGIIKFRKSHTTESSKTDYMLAPIETYNPPFLPQTLLSSKFAKLCPFLPYYPKPKVAENNTEL